MQVAQFSAELERYQPAIAIYEDVARTSMDNNLLKYSAKGYLLCAGICRLCGASFRATCSDLHSLQAGVPSVSHMLLLLWHGGLGQRPCTACSRAGVSSRSTCAHFL